MSMHAYFPGEPIHPLVDAAVDKLLGADTHTPWPSLTNNVQEALLLLREITTPTLQELQQKVSDLEEDNRRLRRTSTHRQP